MSKLHKITKENLSEILDNNELTVVQFSAAWCGPCRMLGPIVEDIANNNEMEGVAIGKVDVEENRELGSEYEIRSLPTLVFIKGGEVIEKMVGLQRKDALVNKIKELSGNE